MMTTLETVPLAAYELDYPSEADAVYLDLQERRQALEAQFGDLTDYEVSPPSVALWEHYGAAHQQVAFDLSDLPGGSFKYYSALGALLTMAEHETTAATATAGGYGGALAYGARLLAKKSVAYTPEDLSALKYGVMDDSGMDVLPHYPDVATAIKALERDCAKNDGWALLHPFNNPNGIATLTLLTDQVVGTLLAMEAAGKLDLRTMDVKIPVQRGGGSLITAMAFSVRMAKEAGLLGDNVSVIEVRPELTDDGELDPLFDGLRVADPGSVAAPLLSDPEYIQGTHYTSRAAVADGARKVARAAPDVHYEANALAGMGAYMDMRRVDTRPTLYVTLLSGRNASDAQRNELLAMPGLEQLPMSTRNRHAVGSTLLSGLTAEDRAYTPSPATHLAPNYQRYTPDPEAIAEYYNQLERDFGISLFRASQYQR